MWAGLPIDWPTRHRLAVLQPTPPIAYGITIDKFIVFPRIWYSQPISVARYRREITDKDKCLINVFTTPHKRHHRSPWPPARMIASTLLIAQLILSPAESLPPLPQREFGSCYPTSGTFPAGGSAHMRSFFSRSSCETVLHIWYDNHMT